jgi:hypothetical protein
MEAIDLIVICLAVTALAISLMTIIFDCIFFRVHLNMARTSIKDSSEIAAEMKTILNEIRITQNITGQQVKDQYDKLLDAAIHGSGNPISEAAISAVALQKLTERVNSLEESVVKVKSTEQVQAEVRDIKETVANLSRALGRFASGVVSEQQRPSQSRFETFTQEARKSLAISQEIAQIHHNKFIDVEHILLSVLHKKGFTARKLIDTLGVSIHKIVEAITLLIPTTAEEETDIRLAPRAKEAIEFAIDESRKLKSKHIGTEHLLMGVILVKGASSEVLKQYGINIENVRDAALKLPPA